MTRSEYAREVRQRIANNVRFYRQQRGWTQGDMAYECGLSENTVYLLENDTKPYNVPIASLASLANAMRLTIEDFLVPRETPPNPRGKLARAYLDQCGEDYADADRN